MRSTSIYGGGLFGNSQPASQPSTGETVSNAGTDTASTPQRNIDQTELEVAWRKASNDLASIDRAINMRMESITPTLKSQTEIELPVGNQDVESFFRNHKNEIFSHLKKYIGEGPLQMTYKIVDTGGPQKILSPYEQMLEMTKQNPALNKLRETLGLTVE